MPSSKHPMPDARRLRFGLRWIAALFAALLPSSVAADQIITAGRNFTGADIVGFDAGELRFRSAHGRLWSADIDHVDMMIVDRGGVFADFNQAERFLAGGEPVRALSRYRRTHRLVDDFWPDLVAARLTQAADRAGRLDEAVRSWISILRGRFAGPPAAARLIPYNIPEKRDSRTARALDDISAALAVPPPEPQRALLLIVRFEILRRQAVSREANGSGGEAGERRTEGPSRPEANDAWTTHAVQIATMRIPPQARSDRVYAIQAAALERVAAGDLLPHSELRAALDQAIRDAPEPVVPRVLLLKGQVLFQAASSREDYVRASWPFLRAAIHFPDRAEAADGLLGAARILLRMGRSDKALMLLEECLTHEQLTSETRRQAERLSAPLRAAAARGGGEEFK